ncbi:hypothetical protein [Brevibacillus sp. AY1]|uniref:hypothetical protein n=1 Tax=Brevibacillus sp. AY1 TaxID=2807621 RepID=UPI0024558442|nr:hypothetical protein [Brevibacillus sp. AY1]MDH4617986.1 hypothetical protein [Brevibacillus sp. AY1]
MNQTNKRILAPSKKVQYVGFRYYVYGYHQVLFQDMNEEDGGEFYEGARWEIAGMLHSIPGVVSREVDDGVIQVEVTFPICVDEPFSWNQLVVVQQKLKEFLEEKTDAMLSCEAGDILFFSRDIEDNPQWLHQATSFRSLLLQLESSDWYTWISVENSRDWHG